MHSFFRAVEFGPGKEFERVDFIDRVDGPLEVFLEAEGHGRVDAHAALESGV